MSSAKKIGQVVAGVVLILGVAVGGAWSLYSWWDQSQSRQIVHIDAEQIAAAKPPPPPATAAPTVPGTAANANAAPAAVRAPAAPAANAPVDLTGVAVQLSSTDAATRQKAVDQLRSMAQTDRRSLAVGITRWARPLLLTRQYADLQELAQISIAERAFDTNIVSTAQRAVVQALLGQQSYTEALPQAKAYYDIADLGGTQEAINFISQALAKTASQADADNFRKNQSARPAVLGAISVDGTMYDARLTGYASQINAGNASWNTYMARGNLLLVTDGPADAKQCFIDAMRAYGDTEKNARLALDGVARAVRDINGDMAPAVALLVSLATDPTKDGPALQEANKPPLDNLRQAATEILSRAKINPRTGR